MAEHTLIRGDTKTIVVTVLDGNDDPFSLVGCLCRFTAKRSKADPDVDAVISRSTGSGITQTNNVATVIITPALTSGLTAEEHLFYDFQVTDGSGNVYTTETGMLRVSRDISRTTP